jgi:hypothetical protein
MLGADSQHPRQNASRSQRMVRVDSLDFDRKKATYRGFIGATKQAHRSRSVACPQLLKAQNESEDRRRKRIEFLIADRGHSLGGPVV